jgi:hypothetical protein
VTSASFTWLSTRASHFFPGMFVFVVPFKCRARSADWEIASRLCVRSINSMLRQQDAECRVILACSEPPDFLPRDERLLVERVDTPVPGNFAEMMADKYLKIKAALIRARAFAPCWLIRADADDLVSWNLARFVEQQGKSTGCYAETGFVHQEGSSWVEGIRNFHRLCGTCFASYVTEKDLPLKMNDDNEAYYLLAQGHHLTVDYFRKRDAPVLPVPFPATIYVRGAGENTSGPTGPGTALRRLKRQIKRLPRMRFLTGAKRKEFGLEPIRRGPVLRHA